MGRPGLTKHRKFRRLARALGGAITARGVLELLWEPCYETGDDYLGTAADIEALVEWTGEAGALALALVTAGAPEGHGFIEQVSADGPDPTYRIHDLFHHAPRWALVRRYKRGYRARGLGDPSRWNAVRVRILERDNYLCRYCGSEAATVDHVIPRVRGGSHDPANLVAACLACNSRKQDRTPEAAGLVRRG